MARTSIKSFTSKGRTVSGLSRVGAPLAKIGAIIPGTNQVYVRPRLRADGGLGRSGSVRVTNPGASAMARAQKGPSIGMGAAGQRGRNFD